MAQREIRDYSGELEEFNPIAIRAFKAQFDHFGGPLRRRDDGFRWYRLRYWDYVKKFRLNPLYTRYLERFHFDFIKNHSLNAIASAQDDVYLVGCFTGAYENITLFFTLMLSHPDVLPEIGDPTREKPWLKSLAQCRWCDPNSQLFRTLEVRDDPPADFPVDPARRLFSHRLAIMAMDFLFFHEIGHLANGHLEFLSSDGNSTSLDEMTFSPYSRRTALDYQALEFNADTHAMFVMTQGWFRYPKLLPETMSFETVSEAVESLVLAMLSVFIMLDQTASSVSAYDSARHPHPAVRLANVHNGTFELADRQTPETHEELRVAWARGIERAQQMCSTLGVASSLWYAGEHEMDAVGEAYDRTAKRFQSIDRQLRPDLHRW